MHDSLFTDCFTDGCCGGTEGTETEGSQTRSLQAHGTNEEKGQKMIHSLGRRKLFYDAFQSFPLMQLLPYLSGNHIME